MKVAIRTISALAGVLLAAAGLAGPSRNERASSSRFPRLRPLDFARDKSEPFDYAPSAKLPRQASEQAGTSRGKQVGTSASRLVSRMLSALGEERFLHLSSLRVWAHGSLPGQMVGSPVADPGRPVPTEMEGSRRGVKVDFVQKGEKLRSQIETGFWSSTEAFDGEGGWRRLGREKPFRLSHSPLQLFAQNGLARLRRLESDSVLLGPDTLLEKTPCKWLRAFPGRAGDPAAGELWIFVEAENFRPVEVFSPEFGMKARLGAYAPVGGVWFPHRIALKRGNASLLELAVDSVETNPPLSDSLFSFPAE